MKVFSEKNMDEELLTEERQLDEITCEQDEQKNWTKATDKSTENPVYIHHGGELYAEEIEQHMAVLPEITVPTEEITIGDVQVGDLEVPLTEDETKLQALIWKSRHLLMGKGNALPLAAVV